jgi:hypothetical protein
LKLGIIKFKVIGRCIGGHAKAFTGPSSEVTALATFAAKRAVWITAGINAVALAMGASDVANFNL